jgi:hypothetical protein
MSRITTKDNIPQSGDIVDNIKYGKDRSIAYIVFDSGKKIYIDTDPVEFGRKAKTVKSTVKENNLYTLGDVGIGNGGSQHQVLDVDKNTPQDPGYQLQVLETIARMDGITVEEARQKIGAPVNMSMPQQSTVVDENFESQKAKILASSEARSRMLAESISSKNGGNLATNLTNQPTMGG